MKIKSITAREILDSRGNPTVEARVILENGIIAKASVASGASTGEHEALELRDHDKKRYFGLGVLKAVDNVNKKIAPKVIGRSAFNQREIDNIMIDLDATKNKENLGANAILSVSLAVCRAASLAKNQPLYRYIREAFHLPEKNFVLPTPTMNIINGGKHADNSLTVQEFMVVPKAPTFKKRVQVGAEIFHQLKNLLKADKQIAMVGDEGGFAPNLKKNEQALDYIVKAIKASGYTAGKDAGLAVDLAMSEYFNEKTSKYSLNDKRGKKFISTEKLFDTLFSWINKYPIVSLEDPLAQDDWFAWQELTKELGRKVILVGDDLFVTNKLRLQKGIDYKAGNAILIKVNQIGTLSETIDAIYLAKKNKYKVSVSHRSGETDDTFIADLACAVNADFLKAGSLSRMERVAKYNRVMEIENEICHVARNT